MTNRESDDVRQILSEIRSLEPFPQVATKVLELSAQEHVLPREIIRVVETDPGVTAKVLKLCNSAFYGFRRTVGSLEEAGNMLGVRTLVDLVLTSSAARYFRDYGQSRPESATELWRRSITTAWAAQILAEAGGGVDRNRAYTVGLLQDIGHLVAERFLRDRWLEIQGCARTGGDLLRAEEEVLGIAHSEIGGLLADRWGLPEVIVDAIRHHHAPERATAAADLAWYGHLADAVAVAFCEEQHEGGAAAPGEIGYALAPDVYEATGVEPTCLAGVEERLRASLAGAADFLEA